MECKRMGAKSRAKGAAGERELAGLLRDRLGAVVTRNLSQTRDGGHDLAGLEALGLAVEVKRYRRATRSLIEDWWAQAWDQAQRAGLVPVLAWRQDRDEWRIVTNCQFSVANARETPVSPLYERTVEISLDLFCDWVRGTLGASESQSDCPPR